jgi:iron complex transport system substrate-binding protein
LDALVAIDNMDYITNTAIINKFNAHHLAELSKGPQPDLEQIISINPDIIFTFGMGDAQKDADPKLQQTGIPVAMSVDHLEATPLARAEWIKFFAAFVDKKQLADSVFSEVEKKYHALKKLAASASTNPKVFSEIKYSDAWYLPGGKSFMAQLINDAGGNYLWKNDTNAGSLPLSFEQVYAKAKDADYWINLSMVRTKAELLSYESRYTEFKAFKTGRLFNNNKIANAKGYSAYWETGMIYPDRILSDLIHIFHPELEPKNGLFYYQQIK